MAKGKGKQARGRQGKARPRPKPPDLRPTIDRYMEMVAKNRWMSGWEPSPEPPMMYTPSVVPSYPSSAQPFHPYNIPQPLHPDNIISHPIRTRVQEKGPSPPWLQALEVPKRPRGKQGEPYWMGVKDSRNEYNRAVTAYRRDQLGRFLGGKGGWM